MKNSSKIRKISHLSSTTTKPLSIYFKILINFSQMIGIIQNLDLKWPSYVSSYSSITGNMGSVSTQFFSVDCLISDYNLEINSIYLKALTNIIIYVVFIFCAVIWFTLRKILFKKSNELDKFIILLIVLSIMIQPASIKETSYIFNCQKILDNYYMIKEISLQCYTQIHLKWVLLISHEQIIYFIK